MTEKEKWLERIERSKALIDKYKADWKKNDELYSGERHFADDNYDENLIYYFNVFRSTIQTFIAQTVPTDLAFHVERYGIQDVDGNILISAFIQQMMKEKILNILKRTIITAFKKPYCIAYLDFNIKSKEAPIEMPEDEELRQEGIEIEEKRILVNTEVEVFFDIIEPEDFLIDPCAKKIDRAKWYGVKIQVPVVDFMKDKQWDGFKYKRKVIQAQYEEYKSALEEAEKDDIGLEDYYDEDFSLITIWEIWDIKERKKLYIADALGEIIYKEDYPIEDERFDHPFVFFGFLFDDGDYLIPPKPLMYFLRNQHDEYNRMADIELRNARRKIQKYAAYKDALSPQDKEKLISPYENTIVEVENMAPDKIYPINNIVTPIAENPIPMDLTLLTRVIEDNIRETIGFGRAERGGMPETRTATETLHLTNFIRARLSATSANVYKYCEDLIKKALIIYAEKLEEPVKVKIGSNTEGIIWKDFKKDFLQDRVTIKVTPGVKNIVDANVRLQEYMNLLKLMAEMANTGVPVNPIPLVRRIMALMDLMPLEIDELLQNVKGKAKNLALKMAQLVQGQPSEQDWMALLGQVSDLLQTLLSARDMQEIQQILSSGQASPSLANVNAIRGTAGKRQSRQSDIERGFF